MPINKELRDKYPADWQEIRARILKRAGDRCEHCGLADNAHGFRGRCGEFYAVMDGSEGASFYAAAMSGMTDDEIEAAKTFHVQLTIAHLDHDVEHNDDSNLAALCCQCHNRHDGHHRARNRSKTRDRRRGQDRFWDNP